jgi:hypothetical protein
MRQVPPSKQLVPVLAAILWTAGCGGGGAPNGGFPAPSNLTAAPMGGGVHLTWKDNSMDEDAFDIERKEGGTPFTLLFSVPFDSALYHDADVFPGRTYTYRVRATRGMTMSAYSNEASSDSGGGAGGATGAAGTSGGAGTTGTAGTTGGAGTTATTGTAGTTGAAGTSGKAGTSGATDGGATDARPDAPPVVISFRRDVAPTLVQTCGSTTAGCHNADQAVGRIMPQFGPCKVIWFSAVDAPVGSTYISGPNAGQKTGCPDLGLYDRLMQLHSMLCDAPTWQQRPLYVVPKDLARSLLYQVIAGDPSYGGKCSLNAMPVTKMPKVDPAVLPNGVPLTQDRIDKIRDWILQGAPNN